MEFCSKSLEKAVNVIVNKKQIKTEYFLINNQNLTLKLQPRKQSINLLLGFNTTLCIVMLNSLCYLIDRYFFNVLPSMRYELNLLGWCW
jgi:hypothetical protein